MNTLGFILNRRLFLKAGLFGVAAGLVGLRFPPVQSAHAAPSISPYPEETAEEAIKRLFGDRTINYDGRVQLTLPQMAENGRVVPMEVNSNEFPAGRSVKNIFIIVDKNKRPLSIVYNLKPPTGFGKVSANLRIGGTSIVRAICELDDNSLYGDTKEVPVVVGGCGG